MWNSATADRRPLDNLLRERINVNSQDLSEIIDFTGGLLGRLYANHCISQAQRRVIQDHQSFDSARKLLEIMSRKSEAVFNEFIVCLKETGQSHAVYILKNNAGKYIALFISNLLINI